MIPECGQKVVLANSKMTLISSFDSPRFKHENRIGQHYLNGAVPLFNLLTILSIRNIFMLNEEHVYVKVPKNGVFVP